MKKLVSSLAFLLITATMSAQLDLGLRAGLGLAQTGISNLETAQAALETADRELSFHAGIYIKVKTPVLFIQPEVIFSQLNQSINLQQAGVSELRNIELDMNRVDIPLLIGKELGPLRIMAGPVYTANLSDLSGDISSDIEAGTFGYQLGLGLELSKLIIDLRYEGAFSPWASNLIVDQTNYQVDMRTSQLLLCIGFELF